MGRPTAEQVRDQIRRDGRAAAMACPKPTVEQMRQVAAVLRPAIARTRDEQRGAA